MTFDAKGRLWVTTMASYPMYLPGRPVDDKVLILEDTDGDGKADKQDRLRRQAPRPHRDRAGRRRRSTSPSSRT